MASKLLSNWERENLPSRENLEPKLKKVVDFRARKKLVSWIEDLQDIKLILDNLPKKQLMKIITDRAILDLFDLIKDALIIIGVPKIVENAFVISSPIPYESCHLYEGETIIDFQVRTGFFSPIEAWAKRDYSSTTRKATSEELERVERLKNHICELAYLLSGEDAKDVINGIILDRGDKYRLIDKKGYKILMDTREKELQEMKRQGAKIGMRVPDKWAEPSFENS